MTREKAIARVAALLKVTTDRGATASEQANARALARKLARKYDLTEEEAPIPSDWKFVDMGEFVERLKGTIGAFNVVIEKTARDIEAALASAINMMGLKPEECEIEYTDEHLFDRNKRVYRVRRSCNIKRKEDDGR